LDVWWIKVSNPPQNSLFLCFIQKKCMSRNLHLQFSISIVLIAGIIYGASPSGLLPKILDIKVETNDLKNVFRAVMGLYFGLAIFWSIGLRQYLMWRPATLSNVLFMGGLGFGRLLSMLLDGAPTVVFALGCIGELVLAAWGWYNLKKY
jgi:hypothetical protein